MNNANHKINTTKVYATIAKLAQGNTPHANCYASCDASTKTVTK